MDDRTTEQTETTARVGATAAQTGLYHQVKADPTARISPAAGIVGDVTIGARSTVLAGAQIRGDEAPVVIGEEANVQECAVVHVDEGHPAIIGRHATIGHGAIVHGCEIGENALIGMGAIVLNGAVVGEGAVVGAGALVTQGKTVPPRTLAMGVPAKVVRELSDDEVESLCTRGADIYVERGAQMVEEGVLLSGEAFKGRGAIS